MKKLTFTLLCLVICMCTVVAQNVKVTGTVTAADDGLPIIGASVLVKGTTIGTVTDILKVVSLWMYHPRAKFCKSRMSA